MFRHINKIFYISMVLFFIANLCACKKIWTSSRTGYIVGPDDIKPVDSKTVERIPPDVLDAAVLLATKLRDGSVKFCSGTLIGPKEASNYLRVVTNHHCFASSTDDGDAMKEVFPETCTNTTVYFGFNKVKSNQLTTLGCRAGTFRSSYDFDVAVFDVAGNVPSEFKPLEFWNDEKSSDGRDALIVHYPDITSNLAKPAGEKTPLPLASVTLDDCKVLGRFDVREWDLDRTLPVGVRHTCDLIHGSSGSALVDKEEGTIIGVNWGGIKVNYDSGVRTDNAATYSKYVQAFMAGKEDETKAELASYKENVDSSMSSRSGSGSSKTLSQQVKKAVCGVTLVDFSNGANILLLVMLFILPLISMAVRFIYINEFHNAAKKHR